MLGLPMLWLLCLSYGCSSAPKVTWTFHSNTPAEVENAVSTKCLTDWISEAKLTGQLAIHVHGTGNRPVYRGAFADGLKNGESKTWYPNGHLWIHEHYKDGRLHGTVCRHYAENGKLFSSTVYSNGVQVGNATYWHPDGTQMTADEAPKSMDLK